MTLKRSPYTGNMMCQCDNCLEVMDFEDDEHFKVAAAILRGCGWVPRKVKDKWTHWCPECVKERTA